MIGILNRVVISSGLKLSRYNKMGLNLRYYSPRITTTLMKSLEDPESSERSGYIKRPSQKALKLQTSDGIPLSYDIIYNSFEYHTITQYCSVAFSAIYVIAGIVESVIDFEDVYPDLHTTAIIIWASMLFLYTNIGTAIISYKSPVRIYHNKDTGDYKAVFNAFKPFDKRVIEFRKGMVEQIPPKDILTFFKDYRYKIKGQELYMFDMCFRYPGDLYSMFDEIEKEK